MLPWRKPHPVGREGLEGESARGQWALGWFLRHLLLGFASVLVLERETGRGQRRAGFVARMLAGAPPGRAAVGRTVWSLQGTFSPGLSAFGGTFMLSTQQA